MISKRFKELPITIITDMNSCNNKNGCLLDVEQVFSDMKNDLFKKFNKEQGGVIIDSLKKVISSLEKNCEYVDGTSISGHRFSVNDDLTRHISDAFKEYDVSTNDLLLEVLKKPSFEKCCIEIVSGDIQLGKSLQIKCIAWFSIFIYKTPVLILFRSIKKDISQFTNDLKKMNEGFHSRYIKPCFEGCNVGEDDDYRLPDPKDLTQNNYVNELEEERISYRNLYCMLTHVASMEKLTERLANNIRKHGKKVKLTVIIDEADMFGPSSSHDRNNKKDNSDTTKSEKLLTDIALMVTHIIKVTGSALPLYTNFVSTNPNTGTSYVHDTSRIFVMKKKENYYGITNVENNVINWDVETIDPFWDETKYSIQTDFEINIKTIIDSIVKRKGRKYNSLLIGEEKVRTKQKDLLDLCGNEYNDRNMFFILYNGTILELLFSSKFKSILKACETYMNLRCDEPVKYGSFESLQIKKNGDIRDIYTLLSDLIASNDEIFNENTPLNCVTISGNFANRGLSFTANLYSAERCFHLTDQYIPNHTNSDAVTISQYIRLMGAYNDKPILTIWTTPMVRDKISNYVQLINKCNRELMNYYGIQAIQEYLENTLISVKDDMHNICTYAFKYMKKRFNKNLRKISAYDKRVKGTKISNDVGIEAFLRRNNINGEVIQIADVNKVNKEEFDDITKEYKISFKKKEILTHHTSTNEIDKIMKIVKQKANDIIVEIKKESIIEIVPPSKKWYEERMQSDRHHTHPNGYIQFMDRRTTKEWCIQNLTDYTEHLSRNMSKDKPGQHLWNLAYINNALILIVRYTTNQKVRDTEVAKNPNQNPMFVASHRTIWSKKGIESNTYYNIQKLRPDMKKVKLNERKSCTGPYIWQGAENGSTYLYSEQLKNMEKIQPKKIDYSAILETQQTPEISATTGIVTEQRNERSLIEMFINECINKTPERANLRLGIQEIHNKYLEWLQAKEHIEKENKKLRKRMLFKIDFEKNGFESLSSKGVDRKNNPGKRGYHLDFV